MYNTGVGYPSCPITETIMQEYRSSQKDSQYSWQ